MPANKILIILGSSRSNGHTFRLIQYLQSIIQADFLDLKSKKIGYFDYDFTNQEDDFLPLMRHIVANYQTLIFATPVYWYSMSAQLKTFFDRISDLLKIDKPTGRLLRGKNMAVLSCSGDNLITDGFYMPFLESAAYLGMQYTGHVHGWLEGNEIPSDVKQRLDEFAKLLLSKQTE